MNITLDQVKMIRTLTDQQLVNVALELLATNTSLFNAILNGTNVVVRINGNTVTITQVQIELLKNASGSTTYSVNYKISAIKLAREMFQLGLKEAKDLVEVLADRGYLHVEWARSVDSNYHYNCAVELVSGPK